MMLSFIFVQFFFIRAMKCFIVSLYSAHFLLFESPHISISLSECIFTHKDIFFASQLNLYLFYFLVFLKIDQIYEDRSYNGMNIQPKFLNVR